MVLKNKRERDRVKTSGLANKKFKSQYKGLKKENFKKSVHKTEECSICYSYVIVCKDNNVSCGKTSHIICGECKVKMKGEKCPMCRSHPINQPIAQDMYLKVHKKVKKPKINPRNLRGIHKGNILDMSPKQSRGYNRSGPYCNPFGPNTNRLVRQKRNRNMFFDQNIHYVGRFRGLATYENGLTDEQVLAYNGGIPSGYNTDSDSDTFSTLSLTDSDIDSDITNVDEISDSDTFSTLSLTESDIDSDITNVDEIDYY